MLSALIPTYNYDCTRLVIELHRQLELAAINYEIILANDASTLYLEEIERLSTLSHCHIIHLTENIGRARIRNLLADKAQYPYLLFMDCDAIIHLSSFIQTYLPYCKPNSIVVGGTAYDANEQNPKYSLRLKYGREREANQAFKHYFTTFNFLIDKNLFQSVRFNEQLTNYGHEDSLFGLEIAKKTTIQHVNNPIIHNGLDSNAIFLQKTEQATHNLLQLHKEGNYPGLITVSRLLRTYIYLETNHLIGVASLGFRLIKPVILKNLLGKHPSLFLFDLYKLGHLCAIAHVSK